MYGRSLINLGKTRLAKQAAKRRKKIAFKNELKALKELTFICNVPRSIDALFEYQLAKEQLQKLWYPAKYGQPKLVQ